MALPTPKNAGREITGFPWFLRDILRAGRGREVPGTPGGPRRLRLRLEEAPGHDRARVCDEVLRRLRAYLSSQGLAMVPCYISGRCGDAVSTRETRHFLPGEELSTGGIP
jgi:hypothetical protein